MTTPPRKTRTSGTAASVVLPERYKKGRSEALSGGFGVAQKVHDTFLDRTVVYKSMQDSNDNGQLLQEIRAIAAARSRHVVEIYDVIFDSDVKVAGIVIEHLPGREFSEFYKEAAVSVAAYLRVLYQLATAVRDIHAAGVTHRDLKLGNIRESVSGILKVFDFGLSSLDSTYKTKNNRGTEVYAAPELYVSDAIITPQMDIYALGVCAWALATAKFPPELLEAPPQRSASAPSIKAVLTDLPEDVASAIDRCLHTNASQRPSAKDLSELFARHLVRDQHKGIFVLESSTYELSSTKVNANIRVEGRGTMKIAYDGLAFTVVAVTGDVFKNNALVGSGDKVDGACLFTFGGESLGRNRTHIPFFPSHPEVIL